MTPAAVPFVPARESSGEAFDYARALLNILEDSAAEQNQLRDAQSAVLNILEDFGEEKQRQDGTEKAVLNILEDFAEEKQRLEDMKRAVLNILEDLGVEKDRLEQAQAEVVRSERAIRASLLEKETLLKEIHHRVKNNLQVIISLLRLQARYLRDEQSRTMFEESQNRVYSISLVHEMLYRTGDLARVDFGEYLRNLAKHLTDGCKTGGSTIEVTVDSAGVQVPVDTAIPCGLIVTELITNALKHAFPAGGPGAVRVAAKRDSEGRLKLAVRDTGVGLPPNLDVRRSGSLGLELVSTLVRQLRGTVEIAREGGASFVIVFQPQN